MSKPSFRWDDGYVVAAPVGSFRPNAWGLYDMHGNVAEWCHDWYADTYYGKSPKRDPTGPPAGLWHVRRGGAWHNGPKVCRATNRGGLLRRARDSGVGFRCVLEGASG